MTTGDGPVTTVMMPAYNAHATVRHSVESVLAQTEPRLELIVVDDASDIPVATSLAGVADARLKIVRHERNRGPSSARNTALALARTPLVSQLDADDLWEPEYLETVLPHFDDPGVGLVYTNATVLGHPDDEDTYIVDPSPHPIDRFPKLAERNPIPALTATMRRDAVVAAGGYARWLPMTQDYHLYLKLAAGGWRFAYIDRKLARFRWPQPGRGRTHNWRRQHKYESRLWVAFALRHPTIPGPKRRVRLRLRTLVEAWVVNVATLGRQRHCPCCGSRVVRFEPHGVPPHRGARCPRCGALEQHRELCARLDELIAPDDRMIHFAPAPSLERVLRPRQDRYVTADLNGRRAGISADVMQLPFGDGEFDVALLDHVAEHVPDDRAALRELYRVLAPGGRALLQDPTPLAAERTSEDRLRALREAGFAPAVIRTRSRRDIYVATRP